MLTENIQFKMPCWLYLCLHTIWDVKMSSNSLMSWSLACKQSIMWVLLFHPQTFSHKLAEILTKGFGAAHFSQQLFCNQTLNCGSYCTVHLCAVTLAWHVTTIAREDYDFTEKTSHPVHSTMTYTPSVSSHALHSHRRFLCLNESVTSNTNIAK